MVVKTGVAMINDLSRHDGGGVGEQANGSATYKIGSKVACTDGNCGKLSRVVVDPVARSLTHLVVAPANHQDLGRPLPVGLVYSTVERIFLSCDLAGWDTALEVFPGIEDELVTVTVTKR